MDTSKQKNQKYFICTSIVTSRPSILLSFGLIIIVLFTIHVLIFCFLCSTSIIFCNLSSSFLLRLISSILFGCIRPPGGGLFIALLFGLLSFGIACRCCSGIGLVCPAAVCLLGFMISLLMRQILQGKVLTFSPITSFLTSLSDLFPSHLLSI